MNELEGEAPAQEAPEGTLDTGTLAPAVTASGLASGLSVGRSPLPKFDIIAIMPYIYVLILGGALYFLNNALLFGSGSIDIRATAVLPLAAVAMGQTFVILTRGIDLSVGGVLSLTTAVIATHGNTSGMALIAEIVILVLLGGLLGALNGTIIATTGLQPFIVTLATWSILDGIALRVLPLSGGASPTQLANGIIGSFLGIPISVWGIILLFLIWFWVRNTRFMTDMRAIGSDEGRARLTGVHITRRKIEVYMVSGLFAALAGVWVAAATASGSPTAGDQFILTSVAAVVIGGTSIFGGVGSGARTIIGAIALLMIPDVIFALNLASFWSVFFQGFLLIVAVAISSLIQQVRLLRAR
jgi:ribose transport system permease protein